MFLPTFSSTNTMPQKRVRNHVNPLSILIEHSFEGFGNDNPIFVDVGACKGEFSAALMEKFPDHNFILFEIRRPLAQKLAEQFSDRDNVAVFDGDAGRNFKSILEPCLKQGAVIKQIFVNFPDPWFKDKHKKRRFVNAKLLQQLSEWIPQETEIVFQTDQKFLFDETLEEAKETPYEPVEFFKESVHGIPTHWEQQKLLEGDDIWRVVLKRSS